MKFLAPLIFICLSLQSGAQKFIELNEQFIDLFQKGNYEESVPVGRKAIELARKEYGEKDVNYAVANHNLAAAYEALKQAENALPYFKAAIKTYSLFEKTHGSELALCNNSAGIIYFIRKQYDSSGFYYERAFTFFIKNPEENYDNLMAVMNNLTDVYFPIGKYKSIQSVYEKILPVIKTKEGTDNANYYTTLTNLGSTLYSQQLLVKSEGRFIEAATIIEKIKGVNSLEYANILDLLSSAILEQGRAKEAMSLILKSYEIKTTIPGVDTTSIVSSLNALAGVHSTLAEYAKADSFYKQAIILLEKAGAQETEMYETILRNLGYSYIEASRIVEAKEILQRVLTIQTKNYGKEHPENGTVLTMIGNTEFRLNQLSAGEAHVKEGLALIVKLYGKENYAVAKGLEILGLIYHKQGNSNEGINVYQEAIALNKKIFGAESRHVASVFSNLGIIYQEMGNFAQAEIILKEAARIYKKLYGGEHPEYALSLANLAMIYVMQGRYFDADPLLADAVKIHVVKGLTHSNNFLLIINNIALMSDQQGMYAEARKLYERLLEIIGTQKDKNTATLFTVLNNLARINLYEKNYDKAIEYSLEATELGKNYFGVRSMDYIKSATNLIAAYIEQNNLSKAQSLLADILPLCKDVMGTQSFILGRLYFNASSLAGKSGNFSFANNYIDSANSIMLNDFRQNFYTLSEKEKLIWWQEYAHRFDLAPSFLLKDMSPVMVANFADKQLQLKGFVLNDAASALRKARQSGNNNLKNLVDEWQMNRGFAGKQTILPLEQRTFSIDSLEKLANELEKQINQLSAGLLQQATEAVDWRKIQKALVQDEAAIEFIRFRLFNKEWTDTIQYAALIILKNNTPLFVPLCTEAQINYCLNRAKDSDKQVNINGLYRSTITGNKNNSKFLGDSLYKLLWQPLIPHLQNITTVSYAPDGLLHKVAFHALPTPDKKNLIDNYELQQYTSIRLLVNREDKKQKQLTSVFLLGNADFNVLPGIVASANASVRKATAAWTFLPGTAKEISSLQQLFTNKKLKVKIVNGVAATEESVKDLDGQSPSVMHLATHGFFLPNPKEDTSGKAGTKNAYALSSDPLKRSGIIATGANNAWNGIYPPVGIDDGILTAFEIAQLDLHETQLVVLSACETALGDVQGSEGVFGLQRAFKMAGVKNIIVSLWQVPDKETVELMTAFYINLLTGKEIREAFHLAQKEMRSKYAPFFWAAFVLVE